MRPSAEIVLVHAPGEGAVVDSAAARLVAVIENCHWVRSGARIWPPGDGLALPVRAKILPLEISQFIVRVKVRGGEARAALEADDFHSRFSKLGCENTAHRAHADDDDICFFDCHGYPLPTGPLAAICSPTMGERVNSCLL